MARRLVTSLTGLIVLSAGLFVWSGSLNGQEADNSSDWIYELRTYTTAEGKLPALHSRFRDHTMKLFEKHGMKNIAYWTPADKENTLIYIVAHRSQEAAKKSWAGFIADPEWQKVFKASRSDGPLVTKVERVYMNSTDYSPMK